MTHDTPQRNYEQVAADRHHMLAQLNGLQRVLELSMSDEATATVRAQIARHKQRIALMEGVVQAFDALEADGYPEMDIEPSGIVQQEITEALRVNQEQVKSAMSQVTEELSYVQDLFGGSRRRGRRNLAEEPKSNEGEGEPKA